MYYKGFFFAVSIKRRNGCGFISGASEETLVISTGYFKKQFIRLSTHVF
jgi:hypothetical protein